MALVIGEASPSNSSSSSSACGEMTSMMALEGLISWTVSYIAVAALVIFFNGLVLVSFSKNKSLRTRTNYFIASLAWADFLVGAISIPGWLALVLTQYYGGEYNWLMVDVWTSFDMLAGIGSIYHLMALSWDRLCAIVWPLRHRLYTRRIYINILCLVWGCALLVSGLSTVGNKNDPKAYNISVIGACFFLPLLVVLVAQGTIFIKINRTRHHGNWTVSRNIRREVRAAKAISIMVFVFVLGWLPFFILSLISFTTGAIFPVNAIFAVKLLQYSNSFFNPILYAQKFPEFRRAYVRMLCVCRSKEDENKYTFNQASGTYRSMVSPSPQLLKRSVITKVDLNGSVSIAESSPSPELQQKEMLARTLSNRTKDNARQSPHRQSSHKQSSHRQSLHKQSSHRQSSHRQSSHRPAATKTTDGSSGSAC